MITPCSIQCFSNRCIFCLVYERHVLHYCRAKSKAKAKKSIYGPIYDHVWTSFSREQESRSRFPLISVTWFLDGPWGKYTRLKLGDAFHPSQTPDQTLQNLRLNGCKGARAARAVDVRPEPSPVGVGVEYGVGSHRPAYTVNVVCKGKNMIGSGAEPPWGERKHVVTNEYN